MSDNAASFDFPEPEVFTAGTVGTPGRRVFYLQARAGGGLVSLKCEKQQVSALAEYLEGILADLPPVEGASLPATDFVEPIAGDWAVGSLAVAWDEQADRVLLLAEELVLDDEGAPVVGPVPEDAAVSTARIRLTRAQAAAFVARAQELVTAGRPPCRICGRPLDPEGHVCPRGNGHHRA
jgi:uncharacterized repeat protein (TIGR03847 family)